MSTYIRWILISNSQQRLYCIGLAMLNSIYNLAVDSTLYKLKTDSLTFMSWYNAYNDNTRRLQALIDTKPSLQQLLDFPDFIELLKAYQPKLLQYLSNSIEIPKDIIRFITQPPKESDSDARKYRLPLLTLMMIETNATCVINSFFKLNPNTQKPFLVEAFQAFLSKEQELLPLLCGYFSQMNVVIWNNRYKEAIDIVYDFKTPLLLLAKHTYNKAIVNTLILYLNLDLTRNPNLIPERTQLKLQIISMFFEQIRRAFDQFKKESSNQKHQIIVQNICDILIEVVEKYYLIADGKAMLDLIVTQQNIDLILSILMNKSTISLCVVNLAIILMRYYCLSSFNQEDPNNFELSKKNQERLEAQPFIKRVIELVPTVCEEIFTTKKFTIYQSKIIEVFIPIVELSSGKLSEIIRSCHFLQNLIGLLFKWPLLSIVHKQVERAYMCVFCSEKRVCEEYRKYLFCSANLIELTAGECLIKVSKFNQPIIKPGWFSYIMKIIKLYSKIQTNDEQINSAIMQRAVLWQKFSAYLMRPYQALSFKDLGSYEDIQQKPPVQFSVRTVGGGLDLVQPICKKLIEEMIQEESMQEFMTNMPEKTTEEAQVSKHPGQDALFMVQDFQRAPEITHSKGHQKQEDQLAPHPDRPKIEQAAEASVGNITNVPNTPPIQVAANSTSPTKEEANGSRSFHDYLSSTKEKIGHQLALQKRSSSQKRLSAHKSRVTSPSPKKKRWDDTNTDTQEQSAPGKALPANKVTVSEPKKQKISLTAQITKPPLIPQHPKSPRPHEVHIQQKHEPNDIVVSSITSLADQSISKSISFQQSRNLSTVSLGQYVPQDDVRVMMSKSAVNLSELKHMQFNKKRAVKPTKSQFRKIGPKDKVFLQFLGVKL